jgi:nicotinamide phosphoribosyltransferase
MMSGSSPPGGMVNDQNEALRRENAMLMAQIKALSARLAIGSSGPGYPLELAAGLRTLEAPMSVMSDSYKAGHFLMYPEAQQMSAYGEFREPMKGMKTRGEQDNRFVFYGMRHYIENFVSRKWCKGEIDAAEAFYQTHCAGKRPYPFPRDLFNALVEENDGYFPVVIEALPEGTVAYIHTPVFIITAEDKYSRLCTFLETLLTMVWYPSCVATLSRYTRDAIEEGFDASVDDDMRWLVDSRLHDFGFRGCASVEQSVLGGCAHLLNFEGSDTMSACYHAQFHLNGGRSVGTSIPATEHSVMTAWPNEEDAINNEIEHFGDGLFAAVMDSYDYDNALNEVLPKVAPNCKAKGGVMVIRPDSGDPVTQVIKGLKAAEKVFGCKTNGKGFKVITGAAVIQGDGINYEVVRKIQEAVLAEGFSAENVAYGMGGGLLQKVNRDTMSFATKLSSITYASGEHRDVMKTPKSSAAKTSLPGRLFVGRKGPGEPPVVYPQGDSECKSLENCMVVVYNKRPVPGVFDDFDAVKARVDREWKALPPNGKPISPQLQKKIDDILRSRGWNLDT